MDKKAKGKKVYESIDILCQEMAKFAVKSRKSKLIEEIENDLRKSEKKKKENKNIIIDFISNSNSNNNNTISNSSSISNSNNNNNSDSSLKIKSKSSSNNFSSKECSGETPKNKLNFENKKNEKDKSIKKKLTKVNINKNKTQKLNNCTKNKFPNNNESSIRNSSTYKIRSFGEISNFKKPKNVSFSVDKKSSNKLNIYNDITDKENDNINKKEIKRKKAVIKGDLNTKVSPIEENDKEESEKNMPIAKNTFSGRGILKKSNRSTDFTAEFFNMHDSISKVIIKSGNNIDNKKNKNHKSKFNSFMIKDDNNKIDNYYVKKNKDNDKKDKDGHDDDNDNNIISFDSEKSFKTTYNKGKKKKKLVNDDIKHNKTFISFNKKKAPENSELELKSNKSLNLCDVTEGLIKFIDSSSKTSEEDEDKSKNSKSSSIDNNNQTIFKNSLSNSVTNSENDSSITNYFNNQNMPNNNLLLHYYKNSKMKQYKNFLDKQIKRQKLTQIKIDKKRKQKELKEIQSCYLSPKINSISLEIIESKGNYIPLFKRAIELENERKMKLLIKQKLKDKNFIVNNSNLSRRTKKQISDFFCAQMDWKDKIDKKNKNLKNQLKQKEKQNNSEIIMKINPKSELIVNTLRKNDSSYNEGISINKSNSIINNSIRLYNDYQVRQKKLKKLRMELTPSFKPMIKKIPLSFCSGNIPNNNNRKENFYKIDKEKDDNSNNCILYRNKSSITIKPQKSRNKSQEKINHIDSEVDQNNQKENNLKSTAIDSKNTKSVQKNTLDILKSKQNTEQNLLNIINSKDKEDKINLNKSNYNSQKDKNNIRDNNINIQIKEKNKNNKNSKNKKSTINNISNNKINSLKNLSNHKTTTKSNNIKKNNNNNNKNNIIKIFQAIKQTKKVENSKKKMSVKLLSSNDKRTSQKSLKIYTNKNQFKGPLYRFSVKNKKSSELFLDKNFNDINTSNKILKDENDSLNEFFNCENIKKVKKNKIEKTILKNFKFNSSNEDEEEEEEKDEIEDTESINENNKIKYASWKQKLKELSKIKNNNKNIDSETSPQTIREMKDKKKINMNENKLYMLNVRNSSSTGNLKPYIISENTEIFYKFFVKNKNIC